MVNQEFGAIAVNLTRNALVAEVPDSSIIGGYQFDELPGAIIEVLDKLFIQVEEDLRRTLDSLLPTLKPKLVLVKK